MSHIFPWNTTELAVQTLLDPREVYDAKHAEAIRHVALQNMKRQLGDAAVETGAALVESREVSKPGCPTQLRMSLHVVDSHGPRVSNGRVRAMHSRHWLVRAVSWKIELLLKLADWLDRVL